MEPYKNFSRDEQSSVTIAVFISMLGLVSRPLCSVFSNEISLSWQF